MLTPDTTAAMIAESGSSSTPTVISNAADVPASPTKNHPWEAKPASPSIVELTASRLRTNAPPTPAAPITPAMGQSERSQGLITHAMKSPAKSGRPMMSQAAASEIIAYSFLMISSATCSRPRGTMTRNVAVSP